MVARPQEGFGRRRVSVGPPADDLAGVPANAAGGIVAKDIDRRIENARRRTASVGLAPITGERVQRLAPHPRFFVPQELDQDRVRVDVHQAVEGSGAVVPNVGRAGIRAASDGGQGCAAAAHEMSEGVDRASRVSQPRHPRVVVVGRRRAKISYHGEQCSQPSTRPSRWISAAAARRVGTPSLDSTLET